MYIFNKYVIQQIIYTFQNGNTPEYYTENKTENDFNDLIEYVEKRKNFQDSGRSSAMSLSRGSPSNLAGM